MTAIPLQGDRAARDSSTYPELHSNEFETLLIHHVPAGSSAGDILIWDGYEWVAGDVSETVTTSIITLGTREGDLEIAASPLKIYNLYGAARTITKVFLVVGTSPSGDDIICDVKVNGTSIFTSPNRPKVLGGQNTGYSTTFNAPTWGVDNYLTWEVDQVGSSISGADLVVHIVHEKA